MTEDDKALVEAMKDAVLHGTGFLKNGKHIPIDDVYIDPRDARIEALSAENERLLDIDDVKAKAIDSLLNDLASAEQENERLREALREVFEEWAGSEGFIPETAPEAYLLQLTKRMADIARAALGEKQ